MASPGRGHSSGPTPAPSKDKETEACYLLKAGGVVDSWSDSGIKFPASPLHCPAPIPSVHAMPWRVRRGPVGKGKLEELPADQGGEEQKMSEGEFS